MDQKVFSNYMTEKAGMATNNTKAITQKIALLTAGTPKDLHQKQLQKKRSLEVVQMLEKCLKFSTQQKKELKSYWNKKIQDISSKRQLNRYWAHFDFDMFYVACELLERPQLKQQPCAVGGQGEVLCTANYAARKLGLRSAMPTFIAKKLCPEVILFKPDFEKYKKFSNIFREILSEYDEDLQAQGLDEAYIELTSYLTDKSKQEQQEFMRNIRTRIFEKTGLTVSCGVGANKMLSKLASQEKKPNNQFILPNSEEEILQYMKQKKIRKIPGIGPVNEYYLKGLGIDNSQDILQNTDVISICFSQHSCEFFVQAALGLGSIEHSFKERKSVGKSETFKPTNDQTFLVQKLKQICGSVEIQMHQKGFLSLNVVFSYQTENYEKKDKTFKLSKYTCNKDIFYESTIKFLKSNLHQRFRLLGIRCSSLLKQQEVKKQSIVNFLNGNKKVKNKEKQEKEDKKEQGKRTEEVMEKNSMMIEEDKEKKLTPLEQIKKKAQFICPICNEEIECFRNLGMFNRHVDKCLKNQAEPEVEPERKESKKRGKSKVKDKGIEAFMKKK